MKTELFISELKTVRLTCKHKVAEHKICGAVVEVSVEKLANVQTCPVCGNQLFRAASRYLVQAIETFKEMRNMDVSLVLPTP